MKILIVGGTGLIGSQLKNQLIRKGFSINILSRIKSKDSNTFLWDINGGYIDLKVYKNKEPKLLDNELKKVALSTFLFAILFGFFH